MVAERIVNMPSNKNSGKRAITQMLVLHSAETPLANGYAQSITANWLNKMYRADGSLIEASINSFAGPDCLVRSVHTDYAAWHATWANALSVGYETTGYAAFTRAQWLTPLGKNMIDRLGREMAADAKIYGIPLKYLSNGEVNQIKAGNTRIKGIATHRQIDPVNRTDPGSGFPYDVLLATIRLYSGVKPTPKPTTKGPEVKYQHVRPSRDVSRTLGKNVAWFLKAEGKDKKFTTNENYACLGGGGVYDIDLFLQGRGLPEGTKLTVMFWLIKNGVKSGYFSQQIQGDGDGTFRDTVRLKRPLDGYLLQVSVESSAPTTILDVYAAEVTKLEL